MQTIIFFRKSLQTFTSYVVVSVLYRLAKYANPTESVLDNDVTLQMQIDDIGNAITHIKTNFPTCLNLNANSIQVLGESAGAHLALMYSYTQANTSYVKSVISMYAPTDMNKYANNLKNKYCFGTSNVCNFTCGTTYFQNTNLKYLPCYFFTDINNVFTTVGSLSSLNCSISAADQSYLDVDVCNALGNPYCNTNMKIIDTYRLLESALRKSIPTPTTDPDLLTMSPYSRLTSTRIIPTFIMHGTGDNIVPYGWLGTNMETTLNTTTLGGLIKDGTSIIFNNTSIPASTAYATKTEKHLIKKYTNAPHGWNDASFLAVRTDVITWLNGHK